MKRCTALLFSVITAYSHFLGAADTASDAAVKRLVEGNLRYTQGKYLHPNRSQESRELSAIAQRPFAVILGCADSRVGPEIVFDQGIGDLFVVRVAGNVVGPLELDSIEYSVLHHQASLVVVLGHEGCGAVDAVLHGVTKDIEHVAALIAPAVKASEAENGELLEPAVKMNVAMVVDQLNKTPVIAQHIKDGRLKVVGGYYNLRTGAVELLKEAAQ